jgi:hypothetical protein
MGVIRDGKGTVWRYSGADFSSCERGIIFSMPPLFPMIQTTALTEAEIGSGDLTTRRVTLSAWHSRA